MMHGRKNIKGSMLFLKYVDLMNIKHMCTLV